MPKGKNNLARNTAIARDYDAGENTVQELADHYGLSRQGVYNALHEVNGRGNTDWRVPAKAGRQRTRAERAQALREAIIGH